MLIGSRVGSPVEGVQVAPPSALHCTPPSLAIRIVPPSAWSSSLFWSYGEGTPAAGFSVRLKSEVVMSACGST